MKKLYTRDQFKEHLEQTSEEMADEVLCDRFKSKGFMFTGNLKIGIGQTISLLTNSWVLLSHLK